MSPGTPTPPSISPALDDSVRKRGTLNMPDPELRDTLQNIRRNRNSRHVVNQNLEHVSSNRVDFKYGV